MMGVGLIVLFFAMSGYFSEVNWMQMLAAVLETTTRLVFAYLIALALGVSIALLVGWSPFSEFFFPIFDVLQNLPSFALIPFFIYFFGYTSEMIIFFAVSSIVWPILFAVLTAIKSAHADLSDAATIFGARGFRRIRHYLAPLSLPAILTGSIVGIAIGWEAVIGAEIITNVAGYGAFIKAVDTAGISRVAVAGMLAILVIVFVINRLVWAPLLHESAKHYAE
jgi:ABC-type nitrate/sulfonate/bicarbonate transport system permease component